MTTPPKPSSVIGVRLPEPWESVNAIPLPPGWANVYRDETGRLTVEPCPAVLSQCSERRRRIVYAATGDDGELVPANDRPGYLVTTADWALMLRNNGRGSRVR